jgi:HK97 family phage major capsid protein
MITAAARAASAVAQVAQEIVTDQGETFGMALAGTHGTAAWVAESGSYTPSDETITQQNMGAFKGTSKIIVSEELRTDEAVELDSYLSFELGARLGALQETAFSVGDGSGKPLGLVNASSPYTVVNAATGSSLLYKLADITAVYKALPAAYRPNASWLMNADDFGSLAGTADTAGGLVFPSLQFDPPSLFGRPVYVSADLPAPAASAKSLVFGDFKRAYGIRRVNGVTLQRQDEIHSDSGQVGFKALARVDGRPLLSDAARILAHSAT